VAVHELPLDASVLHGHFSRELPPVLSVDPGDSVRFSTPDAGWYVASGERFVIDEAEYDGHALAGPIEVRGARAGQTLAVQVDDVQPASRGTTWGKDKQFIWKLEGGTGEVLGRTVQLAPFLGVLGLPPDKPGRHPTGPPRPSGGNIDCKELVAGTTLFLPVPVDGALFSAGDGHARQGDGEVCGCAIECPSEAQLTLDLRDDLPLEWPLARVDAAWIAFGFHEHLGRAARIAVDGLLDVMEREHGLDRRDALALASVVADLRVTQVVNGTLGVHAVLRDDAFRRTA
jgi:acetamidase/formamidase